MRARFVVALAVVAIGAASYLLFFYFRDNFSTHYPVKAVSAHAWRAGEIPWWNDYAGGGQPLAGNPNTLTFYPDNVLYLVLPVHAAFNLHFILHLFAAWLSMRALTRSRWAAWLYVVSGAAISAMCFYNLIVALAVIPFALWAAERGKWLQLGFAFGLLALAGEPVTIVAAAIACAFVVRGVPRLPLAILVSIVIALPQIIAYSEIAGEVERGVFRYSPRTVLSASFAPQRFLEILAGPFFGGAVLFPSLIVGLIVIPAIFRRSRYTLIAAVMFFIALGKWNPLVAFAVDRVAVLRLGRYPEKFALAGCIALIVLAAEYFRETRFKLLWTIVTFVPLIAWAAVLLPVDLWAPYDIAIVVPVQRAIKTAAPGGQAPNRAEYRERAKRLEPIFGAAAWLPYALDRSPDGMYSWRTRIAWERAPRSPNYARIVLGPPLFFARKVIAAKDPVPVIESASFDPPGMVVAPRQVATGGSPAGAGMGGNRIDVETPDPALLVINQTYFRAWVARIGDRELETMPVDLDRLGIVVPAGKHTITLTFGRHRTAVVAAWVLSSILIVICLGALRIEVLDRRAGEVERPADEERAIA